MPMESYGVKVDAFERKSIFVISCQPGRDTPCWRIPLPRRTRNALLVRTVRDALASTADYAVGKVNQDMFNWHLGMLHSNKLGKHFRSLGRCEPE